MADRPMRAKGAGSFEFITGHWYVRVSLPDGTRPRYILHSPAAGCECARMSEERKRDMGTAIAERERARVRGELAEAAPGPRVTIKDFGEQWTNGKLHKRWPDHVRDKRTASDDAERFERYVYPIVGHVPVAAFRLEDAELVMSRLPRELASATRRQVAQLLHRLMTMAVYPARLRRDNPLPRGFLPKVRGKKAEQWLYPDEERRMLVCKTVPIAERMLFGFLGREGMRESEAYKLEWSDLDLVHGVVRLDANKTDDPRAWKLGDDVTRAFERWRVLCGSPEAGRVFVHPDGRRLVTSHLAERLRAALTEAKVTRPELFERSRTRMPMRVHDLRATFVTLALANGRTETWVADRTGHRSSQMINRYRRAARTAAELGLGWLAPMDATIPELAELRNVRALRG
ncbi:integrase-like protein [Virus Rctr16k]|nr:integrase-like protein [Virus Rctr16k]